MNGKQAVCRSEDIADDQMRLVELHGTRILLSRRAGRCHAISAVCPHAGGPLEDGVLHAGTVICPWHKAAFDLQTGRLAEPPAVDHLACFAVEERDGEVRVDPEPLPPRIDPGTEIDERDARCFAIVGAGAAGSAAAQTLRESGFAGRVVMIGREDLLPYDRTLLSKYVLSGKQGGEKSPLQDESFFIRHRIERLARDVFALDHANRQITFSDGTVLDYDAALIATGGTPRPLDIAGGNAEGVHLLRTAADATALLAGAAQARSVIVAGAGFIGMEAAASLRERGLDVTVVAKETVPFETQLGVEIGRAFQRVHERQGVRFRLGQGIAAIESEGGRRQVVLHDGSRLAADFVLVGSGIRPATELLKGLALRSDGGIETDRTLAIAPSLWAAGDIAAFPLRGAHEAVRVEHWRVAQQHGRVAALNMLGRTTEYSAVPVFWTIHYMQRLDYIGHATEWDDIEIDGDLEKPEFLALFVRQGCVAAIAGWGRDRQTAAAIGLMNDRTDWAPGEMLAALKDA